MARRKNLELRQKIWHLYCNNPDQSEIARQLKIDRQLVNYHIKKLKGEINYRLNVKTIEEFAEYRLKVMDSLEREIADVTAKIEYFESQEAYKLALAYREYRKELKVDLYRIMGDGEAVLSLRRKMMAKQEAPQQQQQVAEQQ